MSNTGIQIKSNCFTYQSAFINSSENQKDYFCYFFLLTEKSDEIIVMESLGKIVLCSFLMVLPLRNSTLWCFSRLVIMISLFK